MSKKKSRDVPVCWCGATNPRFHDPAHGWMDSSCAGTGMLNCYCGGDFCVCHNHGEIECPGCADCEDLRNDDE